MLAQYSWGQFALFSLVLVGVYYLIVALLYYRDEMAALFSKKPTAVQFVGIPSGQPSTGASLPLVRPSSVFTPTPVSAPTTELTESATDTPSEPVVNGSLPESTAAATGSDDVAEENAPKTTMSLAETEASQQQLLDEQRVEELDVPNSELAAAIARRAATEDKKLSENFTNSEMEEKTFPIFTSMEGIEPSTTAYEENTFELNQPLFFGFDPVPEIETLDLSTEVAELPTATAVTDYIASTRSQQAASQTMPLAPVMLVGTTLGEQLAVQYSSNMTKLNSLFGPDDE